MKYFKQEGSGIVFAFADDGSEDDFIGDDLVAMTEAEVELHLNPPPITPTREEVVVLIDQERDRRIDAGLEFQGVQYQSRAADRENIAGAAQLAFMAVVAGARTNDLRWSSPDSYFVWIASNNNLVPMDAQTVVAFGRAAAERKQSLILAGRDLKDMSPIPADFTDDKWWV